MTSSDTQKSSPVLNIGILYLSMTWLLLQILWTITPMYDLPPILFRGVLFMFVMAFPLILMMAWVYGILHSKPGKGSETEQVQNDGFGKCFRAVIIVLLSLATVILLADIFVLNDGVEQVVGNWDQIDMGLKLRAES